MSAPHRTSSSDSDSIRKRVGKACDRCRLKKSKCDGSHPCSRCKADNAICVFGERKKSHDKVYPKGYVEMLEQQQSQLVAGLQETYRRLASAQLWPGSPLPEVNGHPLTHDILARLELLEAKQDGSGELEPFEEDCSKLQQRLISEGASLVERRRGSISSDSDHSHNGSNRRSHARTSSHSSLYGTPAPVTAAPVLDEKFSFNASSPPLSQSPAPNMANTRSPLKPSPLHHEAVSSDDVLLQPWQEIGSNGTFGDFMREQQFEVPTQTWQSMIGNGLEDTDASMDFDNLMAFGNQSFSNQAQSSSLYNMQDWVNEPMDVEFSKFVQVST